MPSEPPSAEDLQIEISVNADTDLFAVTVTRAAENRVESVVCIPNSTPRGRAVLRNDSRPDPERFKSPIKEGRRSALGDRWRNVKSESTTESSAGVCIIHDDFEEDVVPTTATKVVKGKGQRFHLRIAYPNGFVGKRRSSPTFQGACAKASVAA